MTSNDDRAFDGQQPDGWEGQEGVHRFQAAAARAAGWLQCAPGAVVSRWALVAPFDRVGTARPVTVAEDGEVGALTVVHGGLCVETGARVEDRVVAGQPEYGYALRAEHAGQGATTVLGPGSVLRAGAIAYAGVEIGAGSVVGHHSLLRTGVRVGRDCLLGHGLSIERGAVIGDRVRMSPGSHITADTEVGDDVFIGAGVRTVNDNGLDWVPGGGESPLRPPVFETGARIGSGAVVLGGVRVGAHAVVGAGAVVLRDVEPGTVVAGNPARHLRPVGSRP